VIASVGSTERGRDLAELGADEVVVGLEGIDQPVDVVLDNVGGPQMVAAWNLLAPGGSLQSIGWTSGQATGRRASYSQPGRRNEAIRVCQPLNEVVW